MAYFLISGISTRPANGFQPTESQCSSNLSLWYLP